VGRVSWRPASLLRIPGRGGDGPPAPRRWRGASGCVPADGACGAPSSRVHRERLASLNLPGGGRQVSGLVNKSAPRVAFLARQVSVMRFDLQVLVCIIMMQHL